MGSARSTFRTTIPVTAHYEANRVSTRERVSDNRARNSKAVETEASMANYIRLLALSVVLSVAVTAQSHLYVYPLKKQSS
jgi:hypothetical protein